MPAKDRGPLGYGLPGARKGLVMSYSAGGRILLAGIAALILVRYSGDRAAAHDPLISVPVTTPKARLYGFIDPTGRMRIQPRFAMALPFADGRAKVLQSHVARLEDQRYGFIDVTGKWAIPPRFWHAQSFREGRAAVSPKPPQNIWEYADIGFIDTKGNFRVEPRYDTAEPFQNGVALVGRVTIIGRWYTLAAENHEGHVDYTYVDLEGNEMGSAAFRYELDRYGPLPMKLPGLVSLWGYVNSQGRYVIRAAFRKAERFVGERACVQAISGNWGYIDRRGSWAIPARFLKAGSFAEGLASVKTADTKLFGFIGPDGRWVIRPQFLDAGGFSEGLARVEDRVTGKIGYIDKTGVMVVQPRFDYGRDFHNGLANVSVGRQDYWINRRGEVVFPKPAEPHGTPTQHTSKTARNGRRSGEATSSLAK